MKIYGPKPGCSGAVHRYATFLCPLWYRVYGVSLNETLNQKCIQMVEVQCTYRCCVAKTTPEIRVSKQTITRSDSFLHKEPH